MVQLIIITQLKTIITTTIAIVIIDLQFHQIVVHVVKIKNVAKFMVWKEKNYGAHNANGRRLAVDLVTEKKLNFKFIKNY